MNLSLGRKANPEQQARMAIRKKKWKQAISYYETQLKANERDYALWNQLGDLHASNKSTEQAIEAWRHALEGFALEGLHDSVLGVGRKMLRHAPHEDEIMLQLAESYLGLEYYADCLSTFRSYLRLAKHRSEPEMKSLFKKLMDSEIRYPHLLDEIQTLFKDSGVEDIEVEKALAGYVERMSETQAITPSESSEGGVEEEDATTFEAPASGGFSGTREGLALLGGVVDTAWGGDQSIRPSVESSFGSVSAPPSLESAFEVAGEDVQNDLPPGEGKDHFDLGVVYSEMSLWDAAISEYENARRDPTYRHKATLGLATCYQKMNDLQKALNLLEAERASSEEAEKSDVHFQLGEVHELLGNMSEALKCFKEVGESAGARTDAEVRIREIQSRLGSESNVSSDEETA